MVAAQPTNLHVLPQLPPLQEPVRSPGERPLGPGLLLRMVFASSHSTERWALQPRNEVRGFLTAFVMWVLCGDKWGFWRCWTGSVLPWLGEGCGGNCAERDEAVQGETLPDHFQVLSEGTWWPPPCPSLTHCLPNTHWHPSSLPSAQNAFPHFC